jgi:hypothetical protein
LGGGRPDQLKRVIAKVGRIPGVRFDYVSDSDEAGVWRRKARAADVAIIRTGWAAHKATIVVDTFCRRVVRLPVNGDDAMIDAIREVTQDIAFITFLCWY